MKKTIFYLLAFVLFGVGMFGVAVKANPSYFADGNSTATATTTLTYMTPGAATTTLYYDSYEDSSGAKGDAATLGVQFTGSSTLSTLNIAVEYAFNNSLANCKTTPTACDWYADVLLGTNAVVSTTTQALGLGNTNVYSLPFSSTSLSGVAIPSRITSRLMTIAAPTRYIRVIFTLPPASLNGGIWATFRPTKQTP